MHLVFCLPFFLALHISIDLLSIYVSMHLSLCLWIYYLSIYPCIYCSVYSVYIYYNLCPSKCLYLSLASSPSGSLYIWHVNSIFIFSLFRFLPLLLPPSPTLPALIAIRSRTLICIVSLGHIYIIDIPTICDNYRSFAGDDKC